MSKKVKRGTNMEMYSSYAIGDDKARLKHEILLQDYHDLLKDTEAKKRKLQKINERKLKLLNEVRFLRKRYRKLMKNPSQQNQCGLLKRPSLLIESRRNHTVPVESPSTSIETSLDLNQSSLRNEDDIEYYSMHGHDIKDANYNNRYGEEEETTLACRDLGGASSSRAGKRKISWQDQYALKV